MKLKVAPISAATCAGGEEVDGALEDRIHCEVGRGGVLCVRKQVLKQTNTHEKNFEIAEKPMPRTGK
jgi:hypothetical protein